MPDCIQGFEIMERAMRFLIDLDSGSFERILMCCNEVFTLRSEFLNDDAVSIYLEIDSMFDKTKVHETQGFCWENLMAMDEARKQELGEKILLLFTVLCRASEQQRIARGG